MDTEGMKESEAADITEAALGMDENEESEGEEVGAGTLLALRSIEFLTQDAEPSGTTPGDARNGFNELSRLERLWTVRHRWPVGARLAFHFYRHWVQLLLQRLGEPPVTILGR